MSKHTCAFRENYDPKTLMPVGPSCGQPATQELYWADGRVSPACPKHGLSALTQEATLALVQITTPITEAQWATRG